MAEKDTPDETYDNAARQQLAEHHEPETSDSLSSEMLESLRAHDETDADLPADERRHKGSATPARP